MHFSKRINNINAVIKMICVRLYGAQRKARADTSGRGLIIVRPESVAAKTSLRGHVVSSIILQRHYYVHVYGNRLNNAIEIFKSVAYDEIFTLFRIVFFSIRKTTL